MSSKKVVSVGNRLPKSYADLARAFRALSAKLEKANIEAEEWKALAANVGNEAAQWKKAAEDRFDHLAKIRGALDLALSGKAGADLREAAAIEENKALKNSEMALLADVNYMRRRITFADNKVHKLETKLLELGYRAGLSNSELRSWNETVHLDSHGAVV